MSSAALKKVTGQVLMQVQGVAKSYKTSKSRLEILKGVDLNIKAGELTYIFGQSGSGKSTLLHILGGLDQPDEGEVQFKEQSIYRWSEKSLAQFRNEKIGFVFQFFYLLPELTLVENVELAAQIGGRNAREKAMELLTAVHLSDRAKHFPSQLSGGEQQRGALARALINDPELVLCDEPTGNLDDSSKQTVIDLIDRLNRQTGAAFCIVTHELDLIRDHRNVYQLQNGKLSRKET
jgi:ABC-type lipoprotein export system ATPase subunit